MNKLPAREGFSRAQRCWLSFVMWCAMIVTVGATNAVAQGFAAMISPPRVEVAVKPGEKSRQVLEITNASSQSAKYFFKSADWTLDKTGGVTFDESMPVGSCRPWVAIEKREITVPGGGKYRYRFEVAVPADAAPGECRFALLIEGEAQAVRAPNGPAIPMSGRIGIIVYVTVGGASPQLDVVSAQVASVNGEPTPVLQVRNTGNAHGRLDGFLSGTDASGKKLEFTVSTLPVLPGETRSISLTVTRGERDAPDKIAYPISIRGNLEWAGKTIPFEQRFSP